jgi:hypothetical protein
MRHPSLRQIIANPSAFGSEDVARAIRVAVARHAGLAPAAEREDVVQEVALELWQSWAAGRRELADIDRMMFVAVLNRSRSRFRAQTRRAVSSFSETLADDTLLGDRLADPKASVEELIEQREQLAELRRKAREVDAYLAGERPLVREIEQLARHGTPRHEIARIITANGLAVTPDAVRQIVSRLQRRFPEFRERWANRAADGAASRRPLRGVAPASREAAMQAASAAGPLIHALAIERARKGTRDWSLLAAAASEALNAHVTSAVARRSWAAFVAELEPSLRVALP